jgi:hypothetical protein
LVFCLASTGGNINMTINEAVADFPPKYLMRVNAPGGAGELAHGDLVLISRDEMPSAGDVVCAHRRDGTSLLMEMETGLYEPGSCRETCWRDTAGCYSA